MKRSYGDILPVILNLSLTFELLATKRVVVMPSYHWDPSLTIHVFFHYSTKFSPMEKLGVLKSTFEQINQVS